MATTPVTRQQLIDGATDLDTIEAIANSSELTYESRTGGTVKTMAGIRASTKYDVPVTFTSSISVTSETQTVEESGVIYAPIPSELPFTTTGSFSASQWYPIQDPRGYSHVDTIAELAALNISTFSAGDVVRVKNRATVGDGGGGSFYWDAASTATAVQGYIVSSDEGGTGRFIRVLEGTSLTSSMLGLDGTSGDVAILDAALAAVDELVFTAGTYYPYEFDTNNKTIIFEQGVVFKQPDGTIGGSDTIPLPVVHVTGDNVTFRGLLTIDGNYDNNSHASLDASQAIGAFHLEGDGFICEDTIRIKDSNWISFGAGYETTAATNFYINHIDVVNPYHYAATFWNVDYGTVGAITVQSGANTSDGRVRTGSQNASSNYCKHLNIGQITSNQAVVAEAKTQHSIIGDIICNAWKAEDCSDIQVGNVHVNATPGAGFGAAILSASEVVTGNITVEGYNGSAGVVIRFSEVVNCITGNILVSGTASNATDLNIRSADGLIIGDVVLRDPVGTGKGFHFDYDVGYAPQDKIRIGNMISEGHTDDDVTVEGYPNVDIDIQSVNPDATGSSAVFFTNSKGEFNVAFACGSGSVTIDSSYDTMSYTKRGRVVNIIGQIRVSGISTPSGTLTITGLPFTALTGNEKASEAAVSVRPLNLDTLSAGTLVGSIASGTDFITIVGYSGSSGFDVAQYMQATTILFIQATYFV